MVKSIKKKENMERKKIILKKIFKNIEINNKVKFTRKKKNINKCKNKKGNNKNIDKIKIIKINIKYKKKNKYNKCNNKK